jgi:protein-S-isoprenylcysteine O-methyltransferase Ste14
MGTGTATVVAACLFAFTAINLENLLRHHTIRSATSGKPQIEKQIRTPLFLAGVGTIAFFLESFIFVFLAFTEIKQLSFISSLDISGTRISVFEPLGLSVMVLGYVVFIWSVVARGRYATSWQMPTDHKLVDWGPYRYVRHPSYLAYFLMFSGFLLSWGNLLALIPLTAVPGYVWITYREEEMLVAKFGDKYMGYQKRVGRFIPRW